MQTHSSDGPNSCEPSIDPPDESIPIYMKQSKQTAPDLLLFRVFLAPIRQWLSAYLPATQPAWFYPKHPDVRIFVPILATCLLLLMVSGCGPERSSSNSSENYATAEQIAQEYAVNNDVNVARAALSSLSVANPNQWLVYVTETNINQNRDANLTRALIRLSLDMGLKSALIEQNAIQLGLLEPTPTMQTEPIAQTNAADAPVAVLNKQPESTSAQPDLSEAAASSADSGEQSDNSVAPAQAPTPTDVPADPIVTAIDGMNVRSGPGLNFPIIGSLLAGDSALAVGKSPAGDWWQIRLQNNQIGWAFAQLVTTEGDIGSVAVAQNIPTPPPTPVPVPPTATPEPVEQPAAPPSSGNDFVLIEKRLWGVEENGGRKDGPSVICGEKRELHVLVQDAGGNPLNGVHVQAQYGAKEIHVTGSQGKGDGIAEFVLGGGQDVRVVKDVDGREVSSDLAAGMVTVPGNIPFDQLIQGGFCTDDASCQKNIVEPYACGGHYSWSVTFRRSY